MGETCKKGQFIRNPRAVNWGIGILIEDQRGDGVIKAFFEHECRTIELRSTKMKLEEVEDPGSSRLFLENALVDESSLAKRDLKPFPSILKQFLENFPGGFNGEKLKIYEPDDKWESHEFCLENLSKEKWKEMLENELFKELSDWLKRLYTISENKFLATFELIKINDSLKAPEAQKQITSTLYDLLYGDGLM